MNRIIECYNLPEPSTSSQSGVQVGLDGGNLNLHFDYDKDGVIYNHGLTFYKVRSYRYTAELHCPDWKIEESYDNLVMVLDSELVIELEQSTPEDMRNFWHLNHYMIYFDSFGCFEVVAESWDLIPEKKGSLTP
jgi:hypothetical protein